MCYLESHWQSLVSVVGVGFGTLGSILLGVPLFVSNWEANAVVSGGVRQETFDPETTLPVPNFDLGRLLLKGRRFFLLGLVFLILGFLFQLPIGIEQLLV